jgi:opacity protein-like surface antigen
MLGPRIVVGAEGDFSYFNINQVSADYFNFLAPHTALYKIDTSWIATARGRIGYSTGPALIYATGGAISMNHKFHLFRTSLVYRFSGNPLSGL